MCTNQFKVSKKNFILNGINFPNECKECRFRSIEFTILELTFVGLKKLLEDLNEFKKEYNLGEFYKIINKNENKNKK